jgi:hypothetical protein
MDWCWRATRSVFWTRVFVGRDAGAAQRRTRRDAVDAALTAGDVSASRFADYGAQVCQGIEAMRKLVYAFYNQEFSFREFITEFPQLKGDMTDCLMGNLFRDFQPLFDAVAKFAAVPEPLPHGKPLAAGKSCVMRVDLEADQLLRALLMPSRQSFLLRQAARRRPDSELASLPFTLKQELIDDQLAHPPYGSNLTYPSIATPASARPARPPPALPCAGWTRPRAGIG